MNDGVASFYVHIFTVEKKFSLMQKGGVDEPT
jgi:hypothetical protein